jgi:hypothetical protein
MAAAAFGAPKGKQADDGEDALMETTFGATTGTSAGDNGSPANVVEDGKEQEEARSVAPRPGPRHAIFSCITDNFIGLGATFIASLVQSQSIPAGSEVVLLTDPVYAPLSDESRVLLTAILPSLRFHSPDCSFLNEDLVKRWQDGTIVKENIDKRLPNKKSVYLKLCLLGLQEYDAVLWLDSDMFVLRSIAGLFRLPADFAAVPTGPVRESFGLDFKTGPQQFNSGLMLIRRKYMAPVWMDRAIALLHDRKHTAVQDQSLLNALLAQEKKMFLPHCYNWKLPDDFSIKDETVARRAARVIHFVGQSKWKLKQQQAGNISSAFHDTRLKHGIPLTIEP